MKTILQTSLLMMAIAITVNTKAQVPLYSSNPSATAVIFLDFDGHTVSGTGWNYAGPIYCGASGLDNSQITTVFNRVAEDYRPFNINITTDSSKFLAAPMNRRMRVILTVTSNWYGSAGGVAFVSSFTSGDDTPCFVFSTLLGYDVKFVAEAAAHEAGHTLGLFHQASYDASCNKVSDYNYGQGTGEIGWAPIMGVGYYQNFTLWNNGPSSLGCHNNQSDLDIVTTNNGFSYRTDDHAAVFADATVVPIISNQFLINGIIERNTDQDLVRFDVTETGNLQLNAVPYNVGTGNAGSNLDLQVTLFNSAQVALNTYNPGSLLSSIVDTVLNAGTYYLRIEGRGNVYAPNYASLGSYSLQGNFFGNTLPLRVLKLKGEATGDNHKLSWIIDADEQVVNQVLEMSTDGRNFSPVTQSSTTDRQYTYHPFAGSNIQYRMQVTFDNGHTYYSNIITLRKIGGDQHPKLVSNLVNGSSLGVTSPGNFDYFIYNLSGKISGKGTITNGFNNISLPGITSGGVYMIRFMNGTDIYTEKFVRQ